MQATRWFMRESRTEIWIKAGYELLATEGADGIKVERLAKGLKLNKSGFYHYFGSMPMFNQAILQYHVRYARQIALQIEACCDIDPALLTLFIEHTRFFLVESQLLIKRRHSPNMAATNTGMSPSGKMPRRRRSFQRPGLITSEHTLPRPHCGDLVFQSLLISPAFHP